MTAKQLKREQQLSENKISKGDTIIGFWSYKDAFETEHSFSAEATVTEIGNNYILAQINEAIEENHHIIIYPKAWRVYLPKTNNTDWNINNRFNKM